MKFGLRSESRFSINYGRPIFHHCFTIDKTVGPDLNQDFQLIMAGTLSRVALFSILVLQLIINMTVGLALCVMKYELELI